ncbi:hypothetical protein TH63_19030 [Rufibacter radiotolerans]|uniref:SpoIIAA-like protein n=1 Tax=Rufibacter radiotolerans TaxID=1379910 RepID=A0A0H4VPM6_9BACT|nr:hypothetical protein TH63_19030 [Rufibacter radiotolerans]
MPYANIYVDTNLQVIHVEWSGLVPSYIFRQTVTTALEHIQLRELYGCIYDLTNLKSIQQQDQEWLMHDVLPLLSNSTLRRIACLESPNQMGQLDMIDLVYCAGPTINFKFQYFEDVASALDWLGKGQKAASKYKVAQERSIMPFA